MIPDPSRRNRRIKGFELHCQKMFTQRGGAHPLDAACGRECLARIFTAGAHLRAVTGYEMRDNQMIAEEFLKRVSTLEPRTG